jgi:hypothetical protein
MPTKLPAVRLLLGLNLVVVLCVYSVVGVIAYIGTAFQSTTGVAILAFASPVAGIALVLLTILCMRSYDRRVMLAIVAVSSPAYILAAFLNISVVWKGHRERQLAHQFITGESASAAAARAALNALPHVSGARPATPELVKALSTTRDAGKRRALIDLLGAITARDSSVASAFIAVLLGDADPTVRAAAFNALAKSDPYLVDVNRVRYARLAANGLVTFTLPVKHRLYGDSVSVSVLGLVLPRANSGNECEATASTTAEVLISGALAGAKSVDIAEVHMADDGELVAGVRADGFFLHTTLGRKLPVAYAGNFRPTRGDAANVDWCAWLRS